jgi:UDP-3-O-[3-hydroxymyristoyl] glucosamine N-acyltransferase
MYLGEIARTLSCQMEGDETIEIRGVATLEDAQEGDLSFFTNPRYGELAKSTKASGLIVANDCPPLRASLLRHSNPYLTFAKAIELFFKGSTEVLSPRIHPTAWIDDSARIGHAVSIGAHCYVGAGAILGDRVRMEPGSTVLEHASIGEQTYLHSGCVIRERVKIGKRCIIHNNAVIGSDGFGYARHEDLSWYKIAPAGSVVIEDDVEIGACSTVDRATLGETRILKGSKLDNLVQVGHGCQIGEYNLVCAQVGLAGSTRTGKHVILAGQVGSAGHLTVGDGAIVTAQSGIPRSVPNGHTISGSPAIENRQWLRATAAFTRLPELQKEVRQLSARLDTIWATAKDKADCAKD